MVPRAYSPKSLCVSAQGVAEEDQQEGATCHLLQGTVGLGWSLFWWSSPGSTLPQGVKCPINTAQTGWGWWGGLALFFVPCRRDQAFSVSGLVLEGVLLVWEPGWGGAWDYMGDR